MRRIIALIDGSSYSRSVCDYAAWIAGRSGAAVEALHVLGRRQGMGEKSDLSGNIALGARSTLLEELARHDADAARLAQKRGRAILEDAEEILRGAGVAEVSAKLRIGDIIETAAEAEADADMVLIGKRGEASAMARAHLGSNFERIARTLTRPVFVAAAEFKPIAKVLIALDGGAASLKAVDWIARNPLFAGLEIRLLTAGADEPEARRRLDGAKALLRGAGIEAQTEIVAGAPEAAIRAVAEREGIDLLVMGAYSHSRLRTLFIGSTTAEMVRAFRLPVLMFR